MPAAPLLSENEIADALRALPEWSGDASGLHRTYQAADFPAAIRLVDRVADVAEQQNHHPDIDIRWRNLRFELVTHASGGVTHRDVDLAREIDRLISDQ